MADPPTRLNGVLKRKPGRKRRAAGWVLLVVGAVGAGGWAWSREHAFTLCKWTTENADVLNPYWRAGQSDFGPRVYTQTVEHSLNLADGATMRFSFESPPPVMRPGAHLMPIMRTERGVHVAPFVIASLCSGGVFAWLGWRAGRMRAGACAECGYSLAGLSCGALCPECGGTEGAIN